MDEKQLLKQLTEIANKEGYVLLPKSYYARLFNGFQNLQRDLKRIRTSRDKLKEKCKTINIKIANSQPKYASALSGSNAGNDDSSLESRYVSKKVGTHNVQEASS